MRNVFPRWLSSFYVDVPALRPGTVGAYALAFVSVGIATALRVALDPYVVGVQFMTYGLAVVITTQISGFGAGFICAVLSTAAADFFVLEPRWSFNVDDPANVADLLLFGPLATYVAFLVGAARFSIQGYKEREERERLLVREVNHRGKNILSVVEAIARQTAAENPEDFAVRFSERIRALSANQDVLIRNDWRGVEVEDLVRAQLAPFAGLIGSIAVEGPKLRLKAAGAQAVGLALHELATNAGKYGAFSTDRGRVDVGWGTDGNIFTMGWAERGGPPVSAPTHRGFGTVVMKEMAERSVGGKVDVDYTPSGLTWHLTCPAANALEPLEIRARD